MLYRINTAPPVGSCHATAWMSLACAAVPASLYHVSIAQLSCFTNGCSIYVCDAELSRLSDSRSRS